MKISEVKRPWEKKRYSITQSDSYYQSNQWQQLRATHRAGKTLVNGTELSNVFCLACFKSRGKVVTGEYCDHIIARKDGGTDELSNLQTLCVYCDAGKRSKERQARQNRIIFGSGRGRSNS